MGCSVVGSVDMVVYISGFSEVMTEDEMKTEIVDLSVTKSVFINSTKAKKRPYIKLAFLTFHSKLIDIYN